MRIIKRNDDPPHTDDKMEALFDDIYEQFEKVQDTVDWDDFKEKLAVWIADKVTAAYCDGYQHGANDARAAVEQGYLP